MFAQSEEIKINPDKVKKIFAEGRFVGPSITEEGNLSY